MKCHDSAFRSRSTISDFVYTESCECQKGYVLLLCYRLNPGRELAVRTKMAEWFFLGGLVVTRCT